MTENNGDVPQNEIINETETEVTNNEDANMDDVEDKSIKQMVMYLKLRL